MSVRAGNADLQYFGCGLRGALRASRERPALGLYLLALLALGFKWLSPISSVNEQSGWTDILFGAAAAAWLFECIKERAFPGLRAFHFLLLAFAALTLISAAFAEAQGTGARNLLLVCELLAIAFLSSQFASDQGGLDAMVFVVTSLALLTGVLAAVGLALFYAHVHTSLIDSYGAYFEPSDRYARIAAGFDSAPLLSSFCIFASGMVAQESVQVPRRVRIATQVVLGLLVLSTLSRGAIGFFAAMAVRNGARPSSSLIAKRVAIGAVAGGLLLMVALTIGAPHGDPTRPSSITYEVPDPDLRLHTFDTGFDTFERHPLLGKGPGSFVALYQGGPFRAHFTPLNVAATTGLPALLVLIALVIALWRNRRRPTPIATWSGLLGLGLDGLGQDIEHFRHVWVLIGVADAQRRNPEERS
jgi:O-antigen ligase/polysaccharide polymerase Wzy-like membrane protein